MPILSESKGEIVKIFDISLNFTNYGMSLYSAMQYIDYYSLSIIFGRV
jgi:hypothetical protein